MKKYLSYLVFYTLIAGILHYTVKYAATEGCKRGAYVALNIFFDGGVVYTKEIDEGMARVCKLELKK